MPDKNLYSLVFGIASIATPPADHNNRNVQPLRRADKIRPDFQLHEQTDRGLNAPEGAVYNPGKIEREIENLVSLAEKSRRTGKAGIRGRADDNLEITEPGS